MPLPKVIALRAAQEASRIMMRFYGKKVPGVRSKGTSLVTSVDLACNKAMVSLIRKHFPDHNIITEEDSPLDKNSPYTWHIDPIDGTHNYIRGLEIFGTSIALEKDGEVVLGVIALPALGKVFVAEKGKGAFCNGKRIHVSKSHDIDFSFILFDSSSSTRRKKLGFMHSISTRLFNERVFGCAVYACAMVAEGKADAFVIFKTNTWDIAAGFLLIEEAGGRITDFLGNSWTLGQPNYVAATPRLCKKILRLLP